MPTLHTITKSLLVESGISAIINSHRDVKVLCAQRFVRLFAYGSTFLILVQFLTSLGIDGSHVGLFMTFTLLGDVVISFCLTLITDAIGRKLVLAVGAILMSSSGAVFYLSSNYWLLLFASVVGVISPSGNEIGPFKAVEESILTQLSEKETRTDIFAWYTLFGTAGAALGTLSCGFSIAYLQNHQSWALIDTYRVGFALYALLGLAKLSLVFMLSKAVEAHRKKSEQTSIELEHENEALLYEDTDGESREQSSRVPASTRKLSGNLKTDKPRIWQHINRLLPSISPASKAILSKLILLFAMDSFASGLASPSWQTYFFTTVHSLSSQALGTLFFVTNMLATVSNLLALPVARRIGPLKTMIFTHLPSAIFLGLISWPPATATGTWLATGFLILRACTQSMDQAPRQAFLGAAVLPEERTAVLGVVNIVKTLAQAGGIGSSGVLAGAKLWVVIFTGAGGLKAAYDLSLLWMFRNLGHIGSDGSISIPIPATHVRLRSFV